MTMIIFHESLPYWIILALQEIETLGDPLTGISDRIDFELIRSILSDLYENETEKG